MTTEQREVLNFLAKGWKLRLVKRGWVLKESGQISSYADVAGGESTLRELRDLGHLDTRNTLTELGIKA